MCRVIESLYFTPKTNITLHANYTSIKYPPSHIVTKIKRCFFPL